MPVYGPKYSPTQQFFREVFDSGPSRAGNLRVLRNLIVFTTNSYVPGLSPGCNFVIFYHISKLSVDFIHFGIYVGTLVEYNFVSIC